MFVQPQANPAPLPPVVQQINVDPARSPSAPTQATRVDPTRALQAILPEQAKRPQDGPASRVVLLQGRGLGLGPVGTQNLLTSGQAPDEQGVTSPDTSAPDQTRDAQPATATDAPVDVSAAPTDEPQEDRQPPSPFNPELTSAEEEAVRELEIRDREVRDHEEAHARVGGRFAGQPSYEYQTGPDGEAYAVSGKVPIDVAPVPDDPEATIAKMEVVKDAALAPAEPSAADRRIAALADAQRLAAMVELNLARAMKLSEMSDQELTELTTTLFRQTEDRPEGILNVAA